MLLLLTHGGEQRVVNQGHVASARGREIENFPQPPTHLRKACRTPGRLFPLLRAPPGPYLALQQVKITKVETREALVKARVAL